MVLIVEVAYSLLLWQFELTWFGGCGLGRLLLSPDSLRGGFFALQVFAHHIVKFLVSHAGM